MNKFLQPSFIKNEPDSLRVNNEFSGAVMAVGYPRSIREGWLDSIISSEGNFDISMHIKPTAIEGVISKLNEELVKQEADLMAARIKGIVNPSLKVQHEDTMRVLEKLQKGEEKLFTLSLYVSPRAEKKENLELLVRKVSSELNSLMIIPKIPYLNMANAIKSIMPLQEDLLKITRNIPSDALAACFPFTTVFSQVDNDGILFGVNRRTNSPIILDPFKFANYNGLVLGTSGGGKSFASKLFIMRSVMRGVRTIVIDPQGEYSSLCRAYGGQVIEISPQGTQSINPLDLAGAPLDEKLLSLRELLTLMLGQINERQRIILEDATESVYSDAGFVQNNPKSWHAKPPRLHDINAKLLVMKKKCREGEKQEFELLENRLKVYISGALSFVNSHTKVQVDSNFTSFDISQIPSHCKSAFIYLIMDFVQRKMRVDRERKMLVIDEAWSLLQNASHSSRVFELFKTARKFNMSILMITQETEDLLKTDAGKTILANTSWKFFARQEPAVIDDLAAKFNLNAAEQNFLITAMPGDGLLVAMNDRIPLRVVASEKEHALVTTNPNE